MSERPFYTSYINNNLYEALNSTIRARIDLVLETALHEMIIYPRTTHYLKICLL